MELRAWGRSLREEVQLPGSRDFLSRRQTSAGSREGRVYVCVTWVITGPAIIAFHVFLPAAGRESKSIKLGSVLSLSPLSYNYCLEIWISKHEVSCSLYLYFNVLLQTQDSMCWKLSLKSFLRRLYFFSYTFNCNTYICAVIERFLNFLHISKVTISPEYSRRNGKRKSNVAIAVTAKVEFDDRPPPQV